jgi:cytochrome c biogenesis protein CcmG/thiol:disulfide interchange protein DsbE
VKPRLVGAIVVGTAALALAACSSWSRQANAVASVSPAKDRKPAPDFSLKDSTGKPVRLSDFRGKVVLLNFWATWCSPCRIEIPWFMEFEQKHKDQGLVVLGVAMDDDGWDVVKPYLERHRVNYRVVMGTPEMADLYGGVESLPTTFLIDREGRVASVHIGLVGKKDYQDDIETLLAAEGAARAGLGGAGSVRAGMGAN